MHAIWRNNGLDMEKFYAIVEEQKKRYMEELFCFLKQKSISATGEGIDQTVEMLRDYMETAGIRTRLLPTSGHPAVYGEVITSPVLPTVLIYGHYDVQPADEKDGWDQDPFTPFIRNERIFCRGSSDDKGQLFTHIKAVEAWHSVYGSLPLNLKFLFEGEEETGSPNLNDLVRENAALLQCDLVVISDSHIHESQRPTIILGLKGMLYIQLCAMGASKDLHSKFAASVESPVWRLLQLLGTMRDCNGNILIDGFYDSIKLPTEAEKKAIEAIPYDKEQILKNLGADALRSSETYGDHYFWNMMFEPTCNIDGIIAGYTEEGAKTVLPSSAKVKIDFRLVPGQDPQDILDKLKRHLEKYGFGDITVKQEGMMYPSRADAESPYVQAIAEAITAAWGQSPLIYPSIGGSGPNYIFTQNLGVECITVPYAGADQNNHGVNENMLVKGFYNGIKTNGEMIKRLSVLGGVK